MIRSKCCVGQRREVEESIPCGPTRHGRCSTDEHHEQRRARCRRPSVVLPGAGWTRTSRSRCSRTWAAARSNPSWCPVAGPIGDPRAVSRSVRRVGRDDGWDDAGRPELNAARVTRITSRTCWTQYFDSPATRSTPTTGPTPDQFGIDQPRLHRHAEPDALGVERCVGTVADPPLIGDRSASSAPRVPFLAATCLCAYCWPTTTRCFEMDYAACSRRGGRRG
jgi:hypothetical protein